MKLSISVPDQLWARVQAVVTEDSPSAVIQAALRRLVEERPSRPAYAQAPAIDAELSEKLAEATARLQREVLGLYQLGYRYGLELASELGWEDLERIAAEGVRSAAGSMQVYSRDKERFELDPDDPPFMAVLARYVGGEYAESMPPDVVLEGMDRALRDVLAQITAGAEVAAGQADFPPVPHSERERK